MTLLTFEGLCLDATHVGVVCDWVVGDVPVCAALSSADFAQRVRVTIGEASGSIGDLKSWEGELEAEAGSPGYSELTPGDPAVLSLTEIDPAKVRTRALNLLDVLEAYEGQRIMLTVTDDAVRQPPEPPAARPYLIVLYDRELRTLPWAQARLTEEQARGHKAVEFDWPMQMALPLAEFEPDTWRLYRDGREVESGAVPGEPVPVMSAGTTLTLHRWGPFVGVRRAGR